MANDGSCGLEVVGEAIQYDPECNTEARPGIPEPRLCVPPPPAGCNQCRQTSAFPRLANAAPA